MYIILLIFCCVFSNYKKQGRAKWAGTHCRLIQKIVIASVQPHLMMLEDQEMSMIK